jgi:hypothetical protein
MVLSGGGKRGKKAERQKARRQEAENLRIT